MEVWSGKKYKSQRASNYDEYLKSVGVNFMTRKLAALLVPIIELIKEGEVFILKIFTVYKNLTIRFKLNEEFDEETMDGRLAKSTIIRKGNTFTQTYRDGPITITREFSDNECVETTVNGDVVYQRWYSIMN